MRWGEGEGLFDRKSVRPVSDMNLHPAVTGDSGERPGESDSSIGRRQLFKETDELKELIASPPPSLHPCNSSTCLKEQNFIKLCHLAFVSQQGGGGGGGAGAAGLEACKQTSY